MAITRVPCSVEERIEMAVASDELVANLQRISKDFEKFKAAAEGQRTFNPETLSTVGRLYIDVATLVHQISELTSGVARLLDLDD